MSTWRVVPEPKRGPVTEETVRDLEAAGLYEAAAIARRYVRRQRKPGWMGFTWPRRPWGRS